ncbi:MAG: hypothetical protein ACOYXA_11155 [Bacteroidota bacterium]
MSLQSEREILKREIEHIEDIELLKAIKLLVFYGLKNEGRITIEQYNKELLEAEEAIAGGEASTHDEIKKRLKLL